MPKDTDVPKKLNAIFPLEPKIYPICNTSFAKRYPLLKENLIEILLDSFKENIKIIKLDGTGS